MRTIERVERMGAGQLMSFEYNKVNQNTVKVEDATGLAITTTSAYDSLYRLSSLTDSNGGVTSYEYDSENRILKETYPDNGTVEYTYDLKGRLLTKTDQAGELCTYTYDSRDLLTQKSYGATGVQTFTYDTLGRMTGSTDNNGGGTAISHSSSKTFDALGRMLTNSQIVGTSPVRILSKEYDAFGHVVKCTRPSGQVVEYTYTNLHQIDEITTDLGNGPEVVQNYDYLYENSDTDNRPLIDKRYHAASTGLVLNRAYDAVGRTTTHDWQKADVTVTGFTYTYDLYGNRLSDTHLHNSADSESYTFDTANRLSAYDRQSGFNQEWTLDDLGNWSSFNDNGVTENRTHNAANEIETKGTDTLEHDAKGNLTKVITDIDNYTTYTWDTLNRLTKVEKTELGVIKLVGQYAYSPENMRVYKAFDIDSDGDIDAQDIHQEFAYCGDKVIEEYYVGSILPSLQYFYSPEYIDEAFMFIDGVGNAKYKLNDIRYSVYAFVDSAGAVQERYKYDPYGKQYAMDANFNVVTTTAVAQDYGFTGRRFDRESGLYYFRARYYDAEQGRFIGRDPLGYVDGMSLYEAYFVPMGVDPWGLTGGLFELLGNGAGNNSSTFQPTYFTSYAASHVTKNLKDAHYNRNKHNDPSKATILQLADRSIFHTHNGEDDNKKYLSPDGHHEAVYNGDGSLVTNNENLGTYNYATGDMLHGILDVVPYILLGNNPEDTTTVIDRLTILGKYKSSKEGEGSACPKK